MSFDGIVTGAAARQLHSCLLGAKIEKVYQPEGDEIVIHCHAGREKYKLYLSSHISHSRVHLTNGADSNPPNPSAFCMLLRKHLQGGRIASVEQKDSERIIEISVDTVNELGFTVNKKLIAELERKLFRILSVENSKKNSFRQHITDVKSFLLAELHPKQEEQSETEIDAISEEKKEESE